MLTYGTATLPEIIWSIMACIGLVTSLFMVNDALKSLFYLQASGQNGVKEVLAVSAVRGEWLRTSVHSISAIVGIISLSLPSIHPTQAIPQLSLIAAIGWTCVSLLLIGSSIITRRTRDRAIEMLIEASRVRASMSPEQIQRDAEEIKVKAHEVEQGAEEIREKAAGMQHDQEVAYDERLNDAEVKL